MVNISPVENRELPNRKYQLYKLAKEFILKYNKLWVGNDDDFIVQFACMNKDSYIKEHCDKADVSSQFIMTLGEYKGGFLHVWNKEKKIYEIFDTYKKLIQFDGRNKHFISNVSDGERYSIVWYKSFDRRYITQPILNGVRIFLINE